jgi:uncharacterized membrane protein
MNIVLIIIGAVVMGGLFDHFGGVVVGGLAGYLFAEMLKLRGKVAELQSRVDNLAIKSAAGARDFGVVPAEELVAPAATETPTSAIPIGTPATSQAESAFQAAMPEEPVPERVVAMPSEMAEDTAPSLSQSLGDVKRRVPLEDRALGFIKNYFTTGNVMVKVGAIVLFFGVAFLLKYAAENTHVPIEFRMLGVALGGIALLVFGWRLRNTKTNYGLILQGAGIGVLYLTIFAAMRLYQLLPAGGAFFLLLGIVAFSAILAIKQDSLALAILGISGGFLAPILTSTGQGSHVMLFSYYAILNLGILAIAWYKAWRPLNVLGFAFTFAIGTAWGVMKYRPENFASTEPFLILFFLFYVAIAILFSFRQTPQLKGYVDGTLVFGTPLVAFGLQTGLVRHYEYALAFSALALSLFYLTVAMILYRRKQETQRLLVEAFLALGVLFGTLAIPLALDGRWTAATWALEGAAILWIGARQSRWLARAFGTLLQFAAGVAFLDGWSASVKQISLLNSQYLGTVFIAGAGLFSSWYLSHRVTQRKVFEPLAAIALFVWGLLWWLGGGMAEIDRYFNSHTGFNVAIIFVAATAIAFSHTERRFDWPIAKWPALGLIVLLIAFAALVIVFFSHPLANLGIIAWPIAIGTYYWILKRYDTSLPSTKLHSLTLWLTTALATWEVAWQIDRLVDGAGTWPLIAWLIVPAGVVLFLLTQGKRFAWPVVRHWQKYLFFGCAPLVLFVALWSLASSFLSDGNPAPLPYIPLLNPLDLAQCFAFLVMIRWLFKVRSEGWSLWQGVPKAATVGAIAVLAFIWVNAMLVRTLHFWAGIPFNFESMWNSTLAQTSLSIFWSVLALCVMVFATRKGLRPLWVIGAALMGVVVLKLFTVDISNIGGLTRIVSFIGVAVLLLAIGYFSPVPPKHEEKVA